MINYRSFSVEELATDEMFRRWIMDPTPEIAFFWNRWTDENPDKVVTVNLARELVLSVQSIYSDDLTDEMLRREIEEITRMAEERKHHRRLNAYLPAIWKAAAVIVLIAGLGVLYFTSKQIEKKQVTSIPTIEIPALEVRTNATTHEVTVLLSDNSVATLAKGSSISYPKNFAQNERRVYLKGEAFFDVSKNENQPFLVYTNETVTKVLGTSFRIKAFDEDNTVLVAVKTGRVSVFPKTEYEHTEEKRGHAGVILSPNEQAIFNRKENRLERGSVQRPEILVESIVRRTQVFDDKPVAEVFILLQKEYGIQIQYNADLLAQCRISAQFDDETLKQRMNAICQAIGATYEMMDGEVVISSRGCN
ncbi:FecR family protein [Dyadobacter sp. CY343]|uniref:FecR family protein n=1 Tax=Dyadobacter sp. CY343 TaxID=2907299 RepID=UPI001F42B004|nr:FecR domain-containing protein [Dyadobacter sp. CY343]MCE7060430.1 FecR domain-containing protein [Dyadobacter sp. CY343]